MTIQFSIDLYFIFHIAITLLFFIATVCSLTFLSLHCSFKDFLSFREIKMAFFAAFIYKPYIVFLSFFFTVLFYRNCNLFY